MKRESGLVALTLAWLALFSLTTLSAAPTAPKIAKPNFARVKAVSPFEIDLTWRDRSNTTNGYQIERSIDRTNFRQIAQVLPGTTTYRDKNLFPGTRYFYRIRAFNASDSSSYDTASARTQTPTVPLSVAEWGAPLTLSAPTNEDIVSIAAGQYHSLALKKDGTVIAWGDNSSGESSVPTNLNHVIAIAAGQEFSLALKDDGTVVEWGIDGSGQENPALDLTNVVAISAGLNFSLALLSDGTVVSWGFNVFPPRPPVDSLTGVVAISAGPVQSLALKSDGTVVQWGSNDPLPTNLTSVVAIAAGAGFNTALKSDGTIVPWGFHIYVDTELITNLTDVASVALGFAQGVALKKDGTLTNWNYSQPTYTLPDLGHSTVAISAFGYGANFLALSTAPAAPSFAQATVLSPTQVQLSWHDNSSDEKQFAIERMANGPAPWIQIAKVGRNITNYLDSTLTTNSIYSYRIRAIGKFGPSPYCPDFNVATSPLINPLLQSVTLGSTNQVVLSWFNAFSSIDGFKIERALDANGSPGAWTEIATYSITNANLSSYVDSTVATNTIYWYRVRTFNALGFSPYSNARSVSVVPPGTPVGLGENVSGNQATFSWFANSTLPLAEGYQVERAPDMNGAPGAWTQIADLSRTTMSYIDGNLSANTTNWYRVRAYNWVGESPYADPIQITILPPDAPYALTARMGTPDSVRLIWFWVGNTDGAAVERAPDVNGSPGDWAQIGTVNNINFQPSFNDTNVMANITYWYRLRAFNAVGFSDYTDPINFDTAPPEDEPDFVYPSIGNRVNVFWFFANDGNQLGFEVERALDFNGDPGTWTQIGVFSVTNNDTSATFVDTNVTANTTNWYRVRSFNWAGYSDYSHPASLATIPPDMPVNFLAEPYRDTVQLSWFGNGDFEQFEIQRAADASGVPGTWTTIATNGQFETGYIDPSLAAGTIYWYRVRAVTWVGASPFTTPISVSLVPPGSPTDVFTTIGVATNTAIVHWTHPSLDADGFRIESAPDTNGTPGKWTEIGVVPSTNELFGAFIDTNVLAFTTNWYRVRASNVLGTSDYSTPTNIALLPPAAPPNFTDVVRGPYEIDVSWWDSDDGIQGYRLERAPDVAGNPGAWSEIYSTSNRDDQSYPDTGLTDGTTYWYHVRTSNWIGDSPYTAPIQVTTPAIFRDQHTAKVSPPTQILSLTQTNGGMLIEWSSTAGNTDVVQASASFANGYTNLSSALLINGAGTTNYFDAGALTNSPTRFYRIQSTR